MGPGHSREGIMPLPNKVAAIHEIEPPKTKKQLRRFIGIINFYRYMWKGRAEKLSPLTVLTSKKAKWKWIEVEQQAFEAVKTAVAKNTLLVYPDFNEKFEIHTDASKHQLGAVISQKGHPIAFFSKKLNKAQMNYTTTEKELLAIVETLKEFRNILLGQRIVVYTDHKNLTYKNFNTERVVCWRMVIEDFGPEIIYIKGNDNVVADAMSRLDTTAKEVNILEKYLELHIVAKGLARLDKKLTGCLQRKLLICTP